MSIRVMTIFGTRPEAIKMAPLVQELQSREGIESICCVTAQHREMLDSVLHIFHIQPDYDLNIMEPRQTLSTITTKCLLGMEEVFQKARPDLVLVHGDTSTTFAGALAAFYHQIKVGHVEAGLRTWDKYSPFPEEMYRKLVGDIAGTLNKLAQNIDHRLVLSPQAAEILHDRQHQRELLDRRGAQLNQFALHPLRIVRAMQDIVNSDVTLTVDMGSFHIWIARYLYSFRARQVMISNGQQTMGVALPWAIGAWLVNPQRKVVSVSGDGGFLQSSMELETAVRLKANILHLIWVDNGYNMVAIQEEKKYQRLSGVEFGPMDFKAYAESFGAKGFAVESAEALEPTLRAAMDVDGPAVVAIPVDYRDNPLLMGQLHLSQIL